MDETTRTLLSIVLLWDATLQLPGGRLIGRLLLTDGAITDAALEAEGGSLQDGNFSFAAGAPARLAITIAGAHLGPGAHATLLTVENNYHGFSFFLRDVTQACPLYAPDCGVAITTGDDRRSFADIAAGARQSGLATRLQRLEQEPEESFDTAAMAVRCQPNCPTWLGLGRDFRSFQINFRQAGESWDWIQPQYHAHPVELPENDNRPVRYNFFFGRGVGCTQTLRRWLEDGVLPILHAELLDGDIRYQATAFTSWEYRPLLDAATGAPNLRGTHYLVADHYGYGNMQTDAQAAEREHLTAGEIERDEETVLYLRITVCNTAAVPRYAGVLFLEPVHVQRADGLDARRIQRPGRATP